ncbi:MAG TPA: hypothetical protein VII99_09955 [Bacteroidia bacterium]
MKKNYFSVILFLSILLLNAGSVFSQVENEDDVYNVGQPLRKSQISHNDSVIRDTARTYNRYNNNYYYSYPYYYPRFSFGWYFPNWYGWYPHPWWGGGWWHHHEYAEGAYFGHGRGGHLFGHRNEVATNHERRGTPHSKPTSTRGGFGSTGRIGGGFSGGHSAGS